MERESEKDEKEHRYGKGRERKGREGDMKILADVA